MKALLIAAVFALVVLFVRSWLKLLQFTAPSNSNESTDSKEMVACATCGVHIPKESAILHADRYYCSKAHAENAKSE